MSNDLSQFWNVSLDGLLKELDATIDGLSSQEVERRRSKIGETSLAGRRKSSLLLLIEQFNSPIILLLFVSAVLSYFFDDTTNALIIGLILVLSGLLGFWQERSAADAVSRLLKVIETKARLLRDQREMQVPLAEVLPGDVVLLQAGSVIPGDCRILESRELQVNESAITGESFPAEKSASQLPPETILSKRTNCLFLGTHVMSGSGKAIVVRIGRDTEFGRISARLERKPPITGFERGLRSFGKLLLGITIALVLVVFLANISFQRPVVESLLFALALAVGMTPQLLPAITSVVLASGAKSMADSQVIVKRLLAIENFGGMTILCMDKTGTITEGTMELHAACDTDGGSSLRILRLASINAHLQSSFENAIDSAIRRKKPGLPEGVRKLDELPYDFTRRKLSILVEDDQQRMIITKGAMDNISESCNRIELPNGTIVSIDGHLGKLNALFETWANQGFRVLALAYREFDKDSIVRADESQMIFAGFLLFNDPLKPDIQSTLTELKKLGIELKLISGDNRNVARTLGQQAGLVSSRVLTGSEIHALDEDQLLSACLEASIFAEIEPEQKERIVLSLKKSQHIVGFLGDGINDAPALHAADIGISVASAVDVAKEAAQVVLLKQDLNVLAKGVLEGRRTLANTLKYVYVSISANFGYMLSMAIASLFLPFLPLLPKQILLINLLADFPAMALATDSVDPEIIEQPRHWDIQAITKFMIMFGLIGTSSDLLTFTGLLQVFRSSHEEFRTGWFVVSILTGLLILLAVRTKRPFFRSRPGFWLILAAIAVTVFTLALPVSPLAKTFELVPLSPSLFVFVLLIGGLYAIAMETGKRIYYRNDP